MVKIVPIFMPPVAKAGGGRILTLTEQAVAVGLVVGVVALCIYLMWRSSK